jgi:putative peptide zinc metalloprotease protein
LQAKADAEILGNRVKREVGTIELQKAQAELALKQQRLGALQVTAGTAGRFMLAAAPADDLPGRYMKKGDLIGYVTPGRAEVARVAVAQDDIDLVREHLRGVRFWIADRPGTTYRGHIVRAVPGATRELPSPALAASNGGVFPLDPRDPKGKTALDSMFLFDIALPEALQQVPFGTRVYVRFQLDWEPYGWQVARRVRQVLLRRLDA